MQRIDMTQCAICADDGEYSLLTLVGGACLCEDCAEFDRTADLDSYEAGRRERLAEAQEF